MSLMYSPWLPDWRKFLDEVVMTPAARRQVEKAIQRKERELAEAHERAYRSRFASNRSARNDRVVGAVDELREGLKKVRSDLASGRMTVEQARGEARNIQARHKQIMDLHDTLVMQDAELEQLAGMTPDQWQHRFLTKFPPVKQMQPSLAAVMAEVGKVRAQTTENPPAPAQETPDQAIRDMVGR